MNLTFNKIKTIKISKPKFTTGFTLVEMMVAIAVFSIVMVTAMSALLNVIDANTKARAIKTAINNVHFALEGISKDMRMGTDYGCSTDGGASFGGDCINGGDAIRYRSSRAYFNEETGETKYAYYKFEGSQIWACLEKEEDDDCLSGFTKYSPITSEEILNETTFYVLGTGSKQTQPRMIMTIKGQAGPKNKPKLQTFFDLQTSVSQRIRERVGL